MPTVIEASDEMVDRKVSGESLSFAEKILRKHGWKSGEGLGKNSQGISEPIKASLKFDKTGVGHDPAKEFTSSWWDDAYKQAANNVIIDSEQDGTVKVNIKKTSKEKKKEKKNALNSQYSAFVQSATLDGGKLISKNENSDEEDEENVVEKRNCVDLTDEELFKACGGLTAHKGARHGHKMSAKQKRIEMQEKELMMQMTKTYKLDKEVSTKESEILKNEPDIGDKSTILYMNNQNSIKCDKKKKDKRKKSKNKKKETDTKNNDVSASVSNSQRLTENLAESAILENVTKADEQDTNSKKKKKKKKENMDSETDRIMSDSNLDKKSMEKHKSKKKRKIKENCDSDNMTNKKIKV